MKLPISFYQRQDVVAIARHLLGKVLCHQVNGIVTSGMIVETEAYSFVERGCHAYRGMTERNKVMFAPGGVSYVYLCYGIHHLFNVVTNREGKADAVLIRALEPVSGIEYMMQRMNATSPFRITSGPGKLTKAMGINRSHNGKELGNNELWVEEGSKKILAKDILASKRIGIDYAGEDANLLWRFSIRDNKWISK